MIKMGISCQSNPQDLPDEEMDTPRDWNGNDRRNQAGAGEDDDGCADDDEKDEEDQDDYDEACKQQSSVLAPTV